MPFEYNHFRPVNGTLAPMTAEETAIVSVFFGSVVLLTVAVCAHFLLPKSCKDAVSKKLCCLFSGGRSASDDGEGVAQIAGLEESFVQVP